MATERSTGNYKKQTARDGAAVHRYIAIRNRVATYLVARASQCETPEVHPAGKIESFLPFEALIIIYIARYPSAIWNPSIH
jgi:hypothetical protein